jgi:indole-3-glycerol phosphate synthase
MRDTAAPDVLAAIVGATRRIVDLRMQSIPSSVLERLADRQPASTQSFRTALTTTPSPRIIAECKRRSPSRGVLRPDYQPAGIAAAYERNGAAAVSVLTEPTFFDGAAAHLQAVRAAVSIPVLRKDFVIHRYQLLEARAWGASAVLLIVAALNQADLVAFVAEADRLELNTLVEVHDAHELERAIDAGATIVGINNRNLKTLEVSTRTSEELVAMLPGGIVSVAESGLKDASDLARLSAAGFDAFLIGERLMTASDPGSALKEMRSWSHA